MRVRASVGLGVLLWSVLAGSSPSWAGCSGPAIAVGAEQVLRGATLTVTGVGWGDDCYDTGPPPAGEGVLGNPRRGIELVIEQDGRVQVLATVDAGADYTFAVDIAVPTDVEPGLAILAAVADGRRTAEAAVELTGASPLETIPRSEPPEVGDIAVADTPQAAPDRGAADSSEEPWPTWPFWLGVGIAVGATATTLLKHRGPDRSG